MLRLANSSFNVKLQLLICLCYAQFHIYVMHIFDFVFSFALNSFYQASGQALAKSTMYDHDIPMHLFYLFCLTYILYIT